MHFEILIEDVSGKEMLENLVPRILGDSHTYKIISYKGLGRNIPKNLHSHPDPRKRILLDLLPKLIRGYGSAFAGFPAGYSAALVIVVDLDDRCLIKFKQELIDILNSASPKPEARFCFAIEEGEAWLLGDLNAILRAYPRANRRKLEMYENDSICGTWEVMADALHKGGSAGLAKGGYQQVGEAKFNWAKNITPHMNIDENNSPSFNYFKEKLRELAGGYTTSVTNI